MEILVLNTAFEGQGVIDTFESFIWSERFSEYGDFEIYTTPSPSLLDLVKYDYYLWVKDSDRVMIVEDRRIATDDEEGNRLIITGRSLESIIDRRIAWKKTVLDGNLQTEIQRLLNETVINPLDSTRQITNFIFQASTDPIITALTIEAQYMGENVYDIIKNICEINNIGYKIVLSDANNFVFSLFAGVDRSYNQTTNPYVIFSPKFENIINSNYLESKKTLKTVTLVAGEGEDLARRTVTVASTGGILSGLDRRELFVDAKDINKTVDGVTMSNAKYDALLTHRGKQYLVVNQFTTTFEGQIETTHTFKFGEDYFLGDIVQIVNEYGIESTCRVIETVRSYSITGIEVYPTFKMIE